MASICCTLCHSTHVELFYEEPSDNGKETYYICKNCQLIFASLKTRPSPDEELQRYNQHENNPDDPKYRAFLGTLFNPMHKRLPANSNGLDFGSGPGPTLHLMFEEEGHDMNIFDPFYANDSTVFDETYDFITSTEVAEHLHHPAKEFERLWNCLSTGGYLGIMTKRAKNDRTFFADWHYRLDDTHVTFYTRETFLWMAEHWNASVQLLGNDVAIFKK